MSALAQSLPDVNYDAFCKFEVMKSDKFKFVMEIPDFSLRPEKQDEYLLENFSINGPGCKITNWLVLVYPKGSTVPSKMNCWVLLCKTRQFILLGTVKQPNPNKECTIPCKLACCIP